MALDAHIAGAVETVIIIEPDREVAVVFPYAILAHEIDTFLVYEGAIIYIQNFVSRFHQHADFHRDKVEYPSGVAHL